MKKIIIILCLALSIITLVGCAEIVSREPIQVEMIEGYDSQEMEYGYVYDWVNGEVRYMPKGMKTVHHDPVYRVRYKVAYSDGRVNESWQTVDEKEYREAIEHMRGGAE